MVLRTSEFRMKESYFTEDRKGHEDKLGHKGAAPGTTSRHAQRSDGSQSWYLFVIFVTSVQMFLGVSRAQQTNHISQKIAKDTKTKLGHKGAAPGTTSRQAQRSDGSQRWYLFVIFVTFCANAPWCFAGSADEPSFTEDRKGHEDKPWT